MLKTTLICLCLSTTAVAHEVTTTPDWFKLVPDPNRCSDLVEPGSVILTMPPTYNCSDVLSKTTLQQRVQELEQRIRELEKSR